MYTLLAEIMESVFHHPKRVISIGRPQKKSSLQPEPSPLNSTCATASVNSSFLSVHHFIINNHFFCCNMGSIMDSYWHQYYSQMPPTSLAERVAFCLMMRYSQLMSVSCWYQWKSWYNGFFQNIIKLLLNSSASEGLEINRPQIIFALSFISDTLWPTV